MAIVGAGVAGLQQARALQKRGIAFTVYEAADDIGGVWRSNYAGFGAQGAQLSAHMHTCTADCTFPAPCRSAPRMV